MKAVFFVLLLVLVLLACRQQNIIISNPVKAETEKQVDNAVAASASKSELEQGRIIYTNRCNRCHNLKPIANFSDEEWKGLLADMIPRAKLTDAEGNLVRNYVMTKLGELK